MFTILILSLMISASSHAGDTDFRRIELLDMAHDIHGYPLRVPARRLVQHEDTEAAFTPERKLEVVETVLKLETELAETTGLSVAHVRLALDVVLDGASMIERALSGSLNLHGVSAYSQAFHAAAVEGLRKDRVGLWLSLMREAREFNGRRAVLRATGIIDFASLGDVRYLGFVDPRWHARVVRPPELVDFAKFHVREIVALTRARFEIEKLPSSHLRHETLIGVEFVLNLLRRQLQELPEVLGLAHREPLTNRRLQQRQPPPVPSWTRLGDEPEPAFERAEGEWAKQLRAIARELHVNETDLHPSCKTNLTN